VGTTTLLVTLCLELKYWDVHIFMFGTKILGCTYLQPHNVHLICTKKCTCLSAVIEIDNEPP
jgi:hypothetical protein